MDIYGKKTIKGIFASKPPHLQEPGESEKKIEVVDMCIDTGLPYEELKEIVRVGTPVSFPCKLQKLVGENLAITGAIKDDVLDIESIASTLCGRLRQMYPELFMQRYKIDLLPSEDEMSNYELLQLVGRKRGHLISGGDIDTERTANMLIDEFRAAKIGIIILAVQFQLVQLLFTFHIVNADLEITVDKDQAFAENKISYE